MRSLFFSTVILLSLLFLNVKEAYSSHAQGAEITYTCTGPNQYDVTVAFFRDCDGISAPTSITIDAFSPSGCSSATPSWTLNVGGSCGSSITNPNTGNPANNNDEVTPLCSGSTANTTCNGGSLPGTEVYYYCGSITLPGQCSDWVIGYGECCRNDQVTNVSSPASNDQYVYTSINNTIDPSTGQAYCNNSPVFTTTPTAYVCPGQPFNYNHGVIDVDGDSLVFSSITPLDDYGVPVTYAPGLSSSNPFNNSNYFNIDPSTGQISAFPNGQQTIAITVLVQEYRNGVLIGETMRDVQIIVLSPTICAGGSGVTQNVSEPPQGAGVLGPGQTGADSLQMCPGNTLTFNIEGSASGAQSIVMTSNVSGLNGASITITYPAADSAVGAFTWTPSLADTGFNTFTVRTEACFPGSAFQDVTVISYSIYVFDEVIASPETATYCGDPIQLNVIGGSSFTWTPAAGLDDPNSPRPIATPSVPTNYIVTSDCGVDSVFINVSQPYAPEAGADTSICLNGVTRLNATAPAQYGPYSYQWVPADGLNNPNIANPYASPDVSTDYTVITTSAAGCEKTDSLTVTISGVAPSVTAYVDPDTVCPGQTVQLSLSVAPSQCGPSLSPCLGNTQYTVGTGTTTSSTSTPYKGFWEDGRILYLYRASELSALGITGGVIQEIAFYVQTINSSAPYNNFTIKMGCTTDDVTPANFPTGLTTVYSTSSETPNTAWNNYVLDTEYDWDGVSNLYVEICYHNTAGFTASDEVRYTATPFQSVLYAETDNSLGCSLSGETNGTFRANTRFNVCVPSVQNATISWTPSANMNNSTITNPQAQVFNSTTFVANVFEGGCEGSGFVDVYVEPTVAVEAIPDTGLCSTVPVQLQAITTGTPSPILLSCGANGTTCGVGNTVRTIGDAIATTSNTSPLNSNSEDARFQYLIRSSELDAAGFTRGIVQSIAFDVTSKNTSGAFENFQISMGCTQQDVMGNDFVTGLDVVYTPKNYNSVAGLNTIVLDNPYDWDGISNIVIDICFDNSFLGIGADIVSFSPSGYNSVLYAENDFTAGGCNFSLANGNLINSSQFRPDFTIDMCNPPAGVFTYEWSPASTLDDELLQNPIASPINSQVYTVTVTDGICIAFDSLEVTFFNGYNLNLAGLNVGCNGASDGNVSATPSDANAPYDFEWSTGQITFGQDADTIFNLSAGTYYLTVTDNSGCVQTDSFVLTVPPPLDDSLIGTDLTCYGTGDGSIEVAAFGGTPPYTYSWDNFPFEDSLYLSDLDSGQYFVNIFDASGCFKRDSIVIDQPLEIIYVKDSTGVSCYGYSDGAAEIIVTGGGTPPYLYQWFDSDSQTTAIASGLSSGTYGFRVYDANNCFATGSVFIPSRDSFEINLLSRDVSCFNSTDGQGVAAVGLDTFNYTFVWQTTPPISGAYTTQLPAGPITVEVTDTNNCVQTKDTIIGAPAPIVLDMQSDSVSCNGGSDGFAEVSVVSGGTAPFTYLWSDNNTTTPDINTLAVGTHYVTVTDDQGCEAYDTVNISEPQALSISSNSIDVSCNGSNDGSISLVVEGGSQPYSYTWSNGSNQSSISDLGADIYSVTVTDLNGCSDSLVNIEVLEPSLLTISEAFSTPTECPWSSDGTINVNANGGTGVYSYTINGSSPSGQGTFNALSSGSYNIIITDENNCSLDTTLIVTSPDSVEIEFDPEELDITLSEETPLTPIITSNGRSLTYSWAPSATLTCDSCVNPVASPTVTTVYELTIFDENDCPYSAQVTVNVENSLILYVPNAFSPNGDEINDLVKVYGLSLETIDFSIFNRWGERVFYTDDLNEGWDGTFKGEKLPPDVYIYYLDAFYLDGQKKSMKGSITLIK